MKGDILTQLRKEKGLTQTELSKKIGVSRATIAMIESGKNGGNRDTTLKISNFFDVSVGYLEGIESKEDEKKKALVSDFIKFLVSNGTIEDENNIPDNVEKMILDMVREEVKNIKKGKE